MRHLVLTESELSRRSDIAPPADGGRADAQRERMSALSREHVTERVQCAGQCGHFVWASGLCNECDATCGAVRLT